MGNLVQYPTSGQMVSWLSLLEICLLIQAQLVIGSYLMVLLMLFGEYEHGLLFY
jgi:hypothetical protein